MHKTIITLILIILITGGLFCHSAGAALLSWGEQPLLKIDGEEYTETDFKNWWDNMREDDQPFPQSLDEYITWLLLAKEGERLGFNNDSDYRGSLQTYLKVLAILQLKNDEVDSKTDLSADALRKEYYARYVPEWHYQMIVCKDEKTAAALYSDLVAEKISVDDLGEVFRMQTASSPESPAETDENAGEEKLANYFGMADNLVAVMKNEKRSPQNTHEILREVFKTLKPGMYSQPFAFKNGFIIVKMLDIIEGDEKHFESARGSIKYNYRKMRQGKLTFDLVEKLKDKFKVTINQERLDALEPGLPESEYSDAALMSIDGREISEKEVMAILNKNMQTNQQMGVKDEDVLDKKKIIRGIDSIISQTVTTLEALDRHYEQQSPVKEMYEFKKSNMLVIKVEKQIRKEAKNISEEDLRAYYDSNLESEFTGPDMYRMALATGSEEDLQKIWLEVVVNGKKFMIVSDQILGWTPLVEQFPANELDEIVMENIKGLNKGDVSRPFPLKDGFAIIYMDAFKPFQAPAFDMIKELIKEKMVEKRYTDLRNEYLKNLRSKTTIEIDEKKWKTIKSEN